MHANILTDNYHIPPQANPIDHPSALDMSLYFARMSIHLVLTLLALALALPTAAQATTIAPPTCAYYPGDTPTQRAAYIASLPDSPDVDIRCLGQSFEAFGRAAVPALTRMLSDTHTLVRVTALYALGDLAARKVDIGSVVPALIKAYAIEPRTHGRGWPNLEYQMQELLLAIGKRAAPALPIMLERARREAVVNPRYDGLGTYFRLAELNGTALDSAARLISTPGTPVPMQSDAAHFIGVKGSLARKLAPLLERAILRLDQSKDSSAPDLIDAYARIAEHATAVPFLLRQIVRAPGMAGAAHVAIGQLHDRDRKKTINALVDSILLPGLVDISSRSLRDLSINDKSVEEVFPRAAARMASLLANPATAREAATGLVSLRQQTPAAADHLVKYVHALRGKPKEQAVYMRALGVVGNITEADAPALLALALAELRHPPQPDAGQDGGCNEVFMLRGFSPLPASMVGALKQAFFTGMHQYKYECGQEILWVLRNADSDAGIDAQISIFVSSKLTNICDTPQALTPRRRVLVPRMIRYLAQMKGPYLPLLEEAIAGTDNGAGAQILAPYAVTVLPSLMRSLTNPRWSWFYHREPLSAGDQGVTVRIVGRPEWCSIPDTEEGFAIYRIHVMQLESPAVIDQLVLALDHRDEATNELALATLLEIGERGRQNETLRRAVRRSTHELARQLLSQRRDSH